MKPAIRREFVDYGRRVHKVSLRLACRAVGISDSVYRYQPKLDDDQEVISELQKAAERYPAYGFSMLLKILRRWGHTWNHKCSGLMIPDTKLGGKVSTINEVFNDKTTVTYIFC